MFAAKHRTVAVAIALSHAACLPTERIEVPDYVDWVAVIGASSPGVEEGRLYPPEAINELAATEVLAWVTGFTTDNLVARGFIEALLPQTVLRPTTSTVEPEITPDWAAALGPVELPPTLTSDHLTSRPPTVVPSTTFTIRSQRLPRTPSRFDVYSHGFDSVGRPLVVVGDSIYRLLPTVEKIGRTLNGLNWLSIAQLPDGRYLVTDGLSGYQSDDLERYSPLGGEWAGLFVRSYRDVARQNPEIFFVGTNQQLSSISSVPEAFGSSDKMQVHWDGRLGIVAAGADWGKMWFGGNLEESRVGIRTPFAVLGGNIVYGTSDGEVRWRATEPEPDGPILVTGTPLRGFGDILFMSSYSFGALLIDANWHLSWFDAFGSARDLVEFEDVPRLLLVYEDSVIVVTSSFYDTTIHTLRPSTE